MKGVQSLKRLEQLPLVLLILPTGRFSVANVDHRPGCVDVADFEPFVEGVGDVAFDPAAVSQGAAKA